MYVDTILEDIVNKKIHLFEIKSQNDAGDGNAEERVRKYDIYMLTTGKLINFVFYGSLGNNIKKLSILLDYSERLVKLLRKLHPHLNNLIIDDFCWFEGYSKKEFNQFIEDILKRGY